MGYRAVVLVVVLGPLFLVFPGRALAQRTETACLATMPIPPAPASFSSGAQPGSDPPTESQVLFVSPEGNLCRSGLFLTAGAPAPQVATDRAPQPGRAFILSAAFPGAGQWYLGKNRWPAYVAVELWAWLQLLDWRREGRHLQDQYKDLAWMVARRVSSGPRTEAGWDYYEAMTKYRASGAYDADPVKPGIQPEDNPGTFNGSVWFLAREIYFPEDPEVPVGEGSEPYQAAFEYYRTRAYTPELAWDWGGAVLHQEEYTKLIKKADEALRSSTTMVGVILANHLLSAVDALVAGRLGIAGRPDPTLGVSLAPGPFSTPAVAVHVRIPTHLVHVP